MKNLEIPINAPLIGKDEILAAKSVLESGILTHSGLKGGPQVQSFEKSVRNFVKSRYAVAVSSGTSALQAALLALDIGRNDEVVIPSFCFVATANAVKSTGAKPVFADITQDNFTIDPHSITKKITKKTRAIIPAHLYGNVAYVDSIRKIARKNNIPVIEDAAQSLGSTLNGRHTGTFFDMGCYSFYPGKVITTGEGGIIVTNNKKLYDKLLQIRNHGNSKTFGLNLRMPEISAAIGRMQIKKLSKLIKTRRKNAKLLSSLLFGFDLQIPTEKKGEQLNYSLYTITTKNRNKILKKLNYNGIGAAVYYTTPIHNMPLYKTKEKLANTDWAAKHVLSLPVHPQVSEKDIRYIAKTLRDIVS